MADNKRPLIRKLALLVAVIIVTGALIYVTSTRRDRVADHIETTGVIEAVEVALVPRTAGVIEFLCCRDCIIIMQVWEKCKCN